jgi:DedD protein
VAWGILHVVKERLTGAIILVALIVLLVPELLTGPIRLRPAPAAAATAVTAAAVRAAHGEAPLRSYTMTLGAPPPPVESSPPEVLPQAPPPTAGQQAGPPESSTPSSAPAAPQGGLQGTKSPAHPVVEEDRSSASSAGWVVQLGSFASRHNAERLARSLQSRGFRMSVSPARAGPRVLWRVRAGPARNHAGAVHLATRLRALGHRGEILPVR